jgi:hypothetical protein
MNNLTSGIPTPPPGFTLNTAMQQNKVGLSWLATNWGGICEQLRSISRPTLVIGGTDDVVPVANSLVIAAKIPGAWVVQIRNAGHELMFQYPDKFNKVLQTFLSTTTNSGCRLKDSLFQSKPKSAIQEHQQPEKVKLSQS